jgi:GTP pyrophosphokinase
LADRSELLSDAYSLAVDAHHGDRRRAETDIDHPLAVASLLQRAGFDEEVVAAALLHDVVEDTAVQLDEINRSFGEEICVLVREMTDNADIGEYSDRKAEHRSRVAGNPRAVAIYAADKLASTRALASGQAAPAEKLRHYSHTLRTLRARHPELPFLGELQAELGRLCR